MKKSFIRIALVGDYDQERIAHKAIPLALALAAKALRIAVKFFWVPSLSLASSFSSLLNYQGIWCVPGSPYKSMEGALNAIFYARENKIPFLGTCGGFQHAILEYVRNMLHLKESDHLEINPKTTFPLITPLTCSLSGTKDTIFLKPGSLVEKIYQKNFTVETFNCHFGLNPDYQNLFEKNSSLHITGIDQIGNARIVELENHPFFIATLYQPERLSLENLCHPLIKAFIQMASCEKTKQVASCSFF